MLYCAWLIFEPWDNPIVSDAGRSFHAQFTFIKYMKFSTDLSSFHCKPLDFSQLFHKIHMSQRKIRLFQEKLDHTMQFSAFLHRIPVRLSAERVSR
jgi:hypothetical protein